MKVNECDCLLTKRREQRAGTTCRRPLAMCRPATSQPSSTIKSGPPEPTSEMVTLEQLNMIVNIFTLAIMITIILVKMLTKRPGGQEAKVASVRSKSSQTSTTTSDPESALHNISQEIAALQAQLMERDIDRIHQESESRIEDMKAEKHKYRVY